MVHHCALFALGNLAYKSYKTKLFNMWSYTYVKL